MKTSSADPWSNLPRTCSPGWAGMLAWLALAAAPCWAGTFTFTTGSPDGKIATLARIGTPGKIQTETADDFTLTQATLINQATFTGLLPLGAPINGTILDVEVEIYHLFPLDTDPANTNVPNAVVPTRNGSPADFEIADATREETEGQMAVTQTLLNASFTASNSVVTGINKITNQTTHGEGPVTGEEVMISVTFIPPIALPAGHYFFRPEALLNVGNFLWLSAPKPLPAPGDLQSWIRNDATPDVGGIFPNWLRIGADIVGAGAFNASFSLAGETRDIICPPNITAPNDPGQCSAVVEYQVITSPGVTATCVPPSGSVFPKGTTTVTCTGISATATNTCTFTVTVQDTEAPRVACRPAPNPAGKKIPVSGKNPSSGQNPDGFYQLLTKDNCDAVPALYVGDSGSTFVAGPFVNGDIVKITSSPDEAPFSQPGPQNIVAHIRVKGDALLYAVDASGNTSSTVACATHK